MHDLLLDRARHFITERIFVPPKVFLPFFLSISDSISHSLITLFFIVASLPSLPSYSPLPPISLIEREHCTRTRIPIRHPRCSFVSWTCLYL